MTSRPEFQQTAPQSDSPALPSWVLLEDGPLLALNKPVDLLTEGVEGAAPSLVGWVKDYLKTKYSKEGNVYLGIPHRLDRASSGVLVMTRNSKCAARVAEQFEKRQVSKIYWALLENAPEPTAGELTDWLLKKPDEARTEVVPAGTAGAKEARLRYRTLGPASFGTLVEIELLTGRMHQIRAQFSTRGCPIVGDTKYGAKPWLTANASATDPRDDVRIALHSRSLTLKHPIRYDEVRIEAPVPDFWNLPSTEQH